MPANLAVAVNPELDYIAIDVGEEVIIMAESLQEQVLAKKEGVCANVKGRCRGDQLKGLTYDHPFMKSFRELKKSVLSFWRILLRRKMVQVAGFILPLVMEKMTFELVRNMS